MTQDRGFTLVELVLGILLLSLLGSIAVPSFNHMLQSSRVSTTTYLLFSHIQLARINALLSGSTIVICPSKNGIDCSQGADDWAKGWLVFRDTHYQLPLRYEAKDELLAVHINNQPSVSILTSLSHIRYGAMGKASNGSLVICGHGNAGNARSVIINIMGRARISRPVMGAPEAVCT